MWLSSQEFDFPTIGSSLFIYLLLLLFWWTKKGKGWGATNVAILLRSDHSSTLPARSGALLGCKRTTVRTTNPWGVSVPLGPWTSHSTHLVHHLRPHPLVVAIGSSYWDKKWKSIFQSISKYWKTVFLFLLIFPV